jgi:hypothetical protein
MSFPQSENQRGYVQKETAEGAINNSSGTATLAGGDAFLCASLDMNTDQPTVDRPDKTGSLGAVQGVPDRITANWSMSCSMAGSGAAGTAPDIDPFLEATFGKNKVVNAATSVVYDPDDNNISLSIWDFNSLATASQRVIFGAIVNQAILRLGDTFGMIEFSGEGRYVLESTEFATAATVLKGGLTTFPSEPTPTTAGTSVSGRKGVITIDGNAYTTFRRADVTIACARVKDHEVFDEDLPGAAASGRRAVTFDLTMRDDDSSNLSALKNKSKTGTAINATYQIGKTAGNIWTVLLQNILMGKPQYDYSQPQRVVVFRGCKAHMTTLSSKDEIKLTLT